MNWILDPETRKAARQVDLIKRADPSNQFAGRLFKITTLNRRIGRDGLWPQNLCSSPENIIDGFNKGNFIEGLEMTIWWGTMWRQTKRIHTSDFDSINRALEYCASSIQKTHAIQEAWEILTGKLVGQLGWSAVIASKTLHFMSRALGFDRSPPVALDNAVIRNRVWPDFIRHLQPGLRPPSWEGNSFGAYCRFMTAVLVWAETHQWTTTEVEVTLFDQYNPKKRMVRNCFAESKDVTK